MNPGGPGASGVRRVDARLRGEPRGRRPLRHRRLRPTRRRPEHAHHLRRRRARRSGHRPRPGRPRRGGGPRTRRPKRSPTSALASEGERLGHLGSVEVAHDIEVIRRALGEDQISFVGLSYGTLIGQLWADALSRRRCARWCSTAWSTRPPAAHDQSVEQVDGVDAAVDAMAEACAADPDCPLTATGGLLGVVRRAGPTPRGRRGDGRRRRAHPARLRGVLRHLRRATPGRGSGRAVAAGLAGDLGGVADLAAGFTGLVPVRAVRHHHVPRRRPPDRVRRVAGGPQRRSIRRSPRFGEVLGQRAAPVRALAGGHRRAAPVDADGRAPDPRHRQHGRRRHALRGRPCEVAENLASGVLLTVEIDGHVAIGDSACADRSGHALPRRPRPCRRRAPAAETSSTVRPRPVAARTVRAHSTTEPRGTPVAWSSTSLSCTTRSAPPSRTASASSGGTAASPSRRSPSGPTGWPTTSSPRASARAPSATSSRGHECGQDHLACYLHNGNEYLESMLGAYKARRGPVQRQLPLRGRGAPLPAQRRRREGDRVPLDLRRPASPRCSPTCPRSPCCSRSTTAPASTCSRAPSGTRTRWRPPAPSVPTSSGAPTTSTSSTPAAPPGMPKGVLWRQADIFVGALGGRNLGTGAEWESLDEIVEGAPQRRRPPPPRPAVHARRRPLARASTP